MPKYLDIDGLKQVVDLLNIKVVMIDNVPKTATNGHLGTEQIGTLKESDNNIIMFHNEKFYLMDKWYSDTDEDETTPEVLTALTYSHTGIENGVIYIKTITVTISTETWVLITTPVMYKVLTQAKYNELTKKSSDTIYYIEDEETA